MFACMFLKDRTFDRGFEHRTNGNKLMSQLKTACTQLYTKMSCSMYLYDSQLPKRLLNAGFDGIRGTARLGFGKV